MSGYDNGWRSKSHSSSSHHRKLRVYEQWQGNEVGEKLGLAALCVLRLVCNSKGLRTGDGNPQGRADRSKPYTCAASPTATLNANPQTPLRSGSSAGAAAWRAPTGAAASARCCC